MTTLERRPVVLRLVTAFVIGFVTLTLEIAYTRVISFKLFYYYTYFVIGLALLGLGASSAFVALSRRARAIDSVRLVQRVAPAAAAAGVIGYAVVARLATDVNLIWTGSMMQAIWQLFLLVVLSVSLTGVFFGVGLLFASLVVSQASEMRRLYFWDLGGAALGCLVAVPLQALIGPPAMILLSLVMLAGLGLVMVLLTGGRWLPTAGAVAAVALLALACGQLRVRTDATKTLKDTDTIVAGDWGAVFRVDAVDLGDLKVLHHDGLWGSSIWRYDGTPATTARFDNDVRKVPFDALEGDAPRVLIIGAAGGNEIMASLTYGAGHVDAVELNPITVDLLNDEFADYSGHIVDDPRVNYVQGDGRTFLARSDDSYDLIWFVAPDSYAASNAATAGAFVLSESYLYTRQMIETAFDHLTPGGAVVAQFGDFAFDRRPTRTARYLVTAREAMKDRVDVFDEHVALIVDDGAEDFDRVSTIMLFASPTTPDAVARIQQSVAELPQTTTKYLPGAERVEGITTDLIVASDDEVQMLVDEFPFEISAIDDNRPFFWHFTSFRTVLTDWSRSFEDNEIAIGERLLLVLVAVGAAVAAVFLWLPFGLTRRRGEAVKVRGRGRLFGYFAALGLGFMLIEISMIQQFELHQPIDGRHSTITKVRVEAAGTTLDLDVPAPAADGRSTVVLPSPLSAEELDLTVTSIDARTTIDRRFGEVTTLPVSIIELTAAPIRRSEPVTVDLDDCTVGLLTIDGADVPLRVTDQDRTALADGAPVTVAPCSPLELSSGTHRLSSSAGIVTGIDVDRVVFDRDVAAAVAAAAEPPSVEVQRTRTTRTATVATCPAGCWLIFGEGYNAGWSAAAGGSTLGAPVQIAGGFNGWWLPPSDTTRTVDIEWQAQTPVTVGLALSALAVACCLVLALRRGRRGSDDPWSADPPRFVRRPLPQLSLRRAVLGSVLLVATTTVLVSPSMGAVAAIPAALLLITRRSLVTGAAALLLVLVIGARMVRRQLAGRFAANAGWPGNFHDLHGPGLLVVMLLLVTALIDTDRPASPRRPQS